MAFDFDNIAGLRRGAFFVANEISTGRDFLQDGYVHNTAVPATFDCVNPLPPHETIHKAAAWTPPGVPPQTLDLRGEATWDDSLLVPAQNPALEGIADETLGEYVARVGEPDFLVCAGGGSVEYIGYSEDCTTDVDPGFPGFGMELDGEGVSFEDGERGYLGLGINAEGVHGQGALDVAVAKAVADYDGDPTNDATLCLFSWAEFENVVLYFEDGYTAHSLSNVTTGGRGYGIRTYWRIVPADGSQLMCVL